MQVICGSRTWFAMIWRLRKQGMISRQSRVGLFREKSYPIWQVKIWVERRLSHPIASQLGRKDSMSPTGSPYNRGIFLTLKFESKRCHCSSLLRPRRLQHSNYNSYPKLQQPRNRWLVLDFKSMVCGFHNAGSSDRYASKFPLCMFSHVHVVLISTKEFRNR